MSLMTDEEYGKYPRGSPRRKCDGCDDQIRTSYTFKVGSKDACSDTCRDRLEGKSNSKQEKSKVMKKDEVKTKKKSVEEEAEVDEAVVDTDETNDPADAEEEDEAPAKPKKKKVVEEDEEDDPAPVKKAKTTKKAEEDEVDEDEAPPKKKAKKKEDEDEAPAKKGGAKKPYPYRKGSILLKLFSRIADGKSHTEGEIFKGLQSPEAPFKRLVKHAKRFKWEYTVNEKTSQHKFVVPKADKDIVLGKEEAE